MEIKVQCDCGQKFKFDVEPVNGRVPFTVNCPVCGADGTPRANVLLQQLLPPQPVASAYAPPPPPAAAPAPAPAPMRPAGLSISRPHAATPAVAPMVSSASESDAESKTDDSDDSSGEGGLKVVHLGWKGWAIIVFLIGAAIFGSYLKSAQRNLVRDVLDWGLAKITGGSSSKSDASGQAIDYKVQDKMAEEEIKADNAAEARAWLADANNGIFEGKKAEVVALMESFYKAGCAKVYITGIEKLAGASVSASMVAVLPSEAAQRKSAFEVANEFAKKNGESGDEDKGQKYLLLTFD
jgi:hypothetical protein